MRIILIFLLQLAALKAVVAQNFNYVHYDTKDGLAGSTIYDMCQDKDGFLWFATDNGLSRYDGTSFKNFTVKDGLPDNEVLKIFADSKGRVWIGTFNKEVCFYFKGKIYNKKNNLLLKKLQLNNFLGAFAEDENGVLALADLSDKITLISESKKHYIVSRFFFNITVSASSFYTCDGKRKILVGDKYLNTYLYINNVFVKFASIKTKEPEKVYFNSLIDCHGNVVRTISQKPDYINYHNYKQYLAFCSTYDGAWSVDTTQNKWGVHYLPGKKITSVLTDAENNLWFSSIGEGVFKLPSPEIQTHTFPLLDNTSNNEVFTLFKKNNKIVAGLNHAITAEISSGEITLMNYSNKSVKNPSIQRPQSNRLFSVKQLSNHNTIYGFDQFLLKEEKEKKIYNKIYPVKSIDAINNDSIIVGTSSYALILRVSDLKITDTLWKERCTKVFYYNDKYYLGTLNGLYEVNKNKSYNYLGKLHPTLTRRISDIKADETGTMWIATADMGIVAYKSGSITAVLKDTNGLSSNLCRTLFLEKNYLWAGTNKGLNKINIANKNIAIVKYSYADGLPSDIINAVYVEDSIVYAGSPEGLTIFNENKISSYSMCKLNMMGTTVNGINFDTLAHPLAYNTKNVTFNYIGISLKSAGEIVYFYKLDGLNDVWQQTNQVLINYPSLQPGQYNFQVYAVNKFGVKSNTLSVNFSVAAPFWKTKWFYGLLILLTSFLAGTFVNFRNKKITKKLTEANALQKQFAALEQQALQAQMNPHFIFNCLNGIQQYILTGNKEKANEYLTCFARLIRQTLDNSGKKSISIADEVNYLREYLEMEKMRAADSFNYTINVADELTATNTEVPAMLLQPYVENALRHGLRYKNSGTGLVEIIFTKTEQKLQCIIRDNGIGRVQSAALRGSQHIHYQSKGMSLTAKRIELLNKINETNIKVVINDLYNNDNLPAGTEIVIEIPF